MKFHWWWLILAIIGLWVAGWLFSSFYMFFFDPEASNPEKRKNWSGRLVGSLVINWLLWPALLPAFRNHCKLHHDMRTGKRPIWIVLAQGEKSGQRWTLADGTVFGASASGGKQNQKSHISADYDDADELSGSIEYRFRMIAPKSEPPSDWSQMKFTPRGRKPSSDDEDAVDAYVSSRYEASLKIPRGKYAVEFRVKNRSGNTEEFSSITMIVADYEDYNL